MPRSQSCRKMRRFFDQPLRATQKTTHLQYLDPGPRVSSSQGIPKSNGVSTIFCAIASRTSCRNSHSPCGRRASRSYPRDSCICFLDTNTSFAILLGIYLSCQMGILFVVIDSELRSQSYLFDHIMYLFDTSNGQQFGSQHMWRSDS